MKRRPFLLASGSAILSGTSISELQKPAVGLEFELSAVPNERPSEIDSLLIKITKLKITPQYLDENSGLDISIELSIEEEERYKKRASNISFSNGEIINKTKIKQRSDVDLSFFNLDNLDRSGEILSGKVTIKLSHPNISTQYRVQNFKIEANIPETVLSEDIYAWYRFEDGDARDYASSSEFPNTSWGSSIDYNGTISGATHSSNIGVNDFLNGIGTGGFVFDGQSDYIYNNSFPAYGDSSRTIMAWCYISNTDNFMNVVSLGSGNNSNERWSILLEKDTLNVGLIGERNDYKYFDAGLSTNQWFHIAFTYDGSGTCKMYRDSTVFNTSETTSFNTVGGLAVGTVASNDAREFFNGKIDDVRVYNRELTSIEITDIYNKTKL